MSLSSTPRLILGSGRSGTTWVLDCLAEANNLRPIFEPLHPDESAVATTYAYEMLAADDTAPQLEDYFNEIASGRIYSRWIDFRAPKGLVFPRPKHFVSLDSAQRWFSGWRRYWKRRRKYRAATKRQEVLIKCIRANLMAPWCSQRLSYRTALIIRHPCSVVESQLRLGKVWDPTAVLTRYRQNARLSSLTAGRYSNVLAQELGTLEALTLNWVIENQWPFEQSTRSGYPVIFYEKLLEEDGAGWRALCNSLGLEAAPSHELLRQPSQQAASKKIDGARVSWRPKWKNALTNNQLDKIQRILDLTECSIYNTRSSDPLDTQPLGLSK